MLARLPLSVVVEVGVMVRCRDAVRYRSPVRAGTIKAATVTKR